MKTTASVLVIAAVVALSALSAKQPDGAVSSEPLLELSLEVVRSADDPSKLEARLLTADGELRSTAVFPSNGSTFLAQSVAAGSAVEGGRAAMSSIRVEISIAAEHFVLVVDENPAP